MADVESALGKLEGVEALLDGRAGTLLAALRRGHYLSTALRLAGIAPWEYDHVAGRSGTGASTPLLRAVELAQASFEDAMLTAVASDESWQARMRLLEGRFAKRWGKRPDVVVNASETGLQLPDDPAERAAVLRALADRAEREAGQR